MSLHVIFAIYMLYLLFTIKLNFQDSFIPQDIMLQQITRLLFFLQQTNTTIPLEFIVCLENCLAQFCLHQLFPIEA